MRVHRHAHHGGLEDDGWGEDRKEVVESVVLWIKCGRRITDHQERVLETSDSRLRDYHCRIEKDISTQQPRDSHLT